VESKYENTLLFVEFESFFFVPQRDLIIMAEPSHDAVRKSLEHKLHMRPEKEDLQHRHILPGV